MMIRYDYNRRGYTLLEVTLALVLSLLLLGAVYAALFATVMQTQAGRDMIEDTNIARAVLNRITQDVHSSLAPFDTRIVRVPQTWKDQIAAAGGAAGGVEGEETEEDTETTDSPAAIPGLDAEAAADPEAAIDTSAPMFNLGVQGSADTLHLFVSQNASLKSLNKEEGVAFDQLTDLRRISYWVASGSNGKLGLARQEVKIATSADAVLISSPMEVPDQENYILAPEVQSIQFQYWDPMTTTWADTWDGVLPGDSEGKKPIGPPAAIKVVLELRKVGNASNYTVTHVIFLNTSNGQHDPGELEEAALLGLE